MIFVSTFSDDRIDKLPFRDSRPGWRFCQDFQVRHRDSISFGEASKPLTTYFAKIERLIEEHHIDPSRIVNIDESGISADKDNVRTCRTKRYSVPKSTPDICDANFSNVNRITLPGCLHASGDIGRPMFVLQWTRMRYRKLQTSIDRRASHLQTIADCLPRGALVATSKDVASVDKINFVE